MAFYISTSTVSGTVTDTPALVTSPFGKSHIVTLDNHPVLHEIRTTATGSQQDIEIDMGASKAIKAIALKACNFQTVELAHASSVGGAYTNLPNPAPFLNRSIKDRTLYDFINISDWTNQALRVRIPGSNSVTDGKSYYAIGFCWIADALGTLSQVPERGLRHTLSREYVRAGEHDIGAVSPFHIRQEWNTVVSHSNVSLLETVAYLGQESPFLVYEELNAGRKFLMIMRYQDDIQFEWQGMTQRVGPRLLEMV